MDIDGMPDTVSATGASRSDGPRHPLEVAFELHDLGVRMRAQRHRRERPDATPPQVEEVVRAWLQDRPGAPFGDCEGRPVTLLRAT